MTLRAAVVGCGRIGCGFDEDTRRATASTHARAYAVSPSFELVALADADGARADHYASRYGVRGYPNYLALLERERPEVVSVCTPNYTHAEIVSAAADAGVRAIFCEKPLADSLAAADSIVDAATEAGVLLFVNHQRRFDPLHQAVAAFIREGDLGNLQQATCYYTAGLANTGTHVLDLLRLLLGEAEWVRGLDSHAASPNPADPNVDAWIGFTSGATAAVQAVDVDAYTIFEVTVLGTRGRIRLRNHGFDLEFERVADSERFGGYRELVSADPPATRSGPPEFMLQAVEHIHDCLETGSEPLSSGIDGRRALELICALRESAANAGSPVALPLAESAVLVGSA